MITAARRRRLGALLAVAAIACAPVGAQEPVAYGASGVQVVQRVLEDTDVVSVRLYLLGGARQLDARTQGVERFVLRVSEYGTEGLPGREVRVRQVETGGVFSVSTGPDWSTISFSGLADDFERGWAVIAERVSRPSFEAEAVEVTRRQLLTEARAMSDAPDAVVTRLAEELAFRGHPYALAVEGTEESLAGLTAADLRAYHQAHFVRSRMLLSVAGPVERGRVEAALASALSDLPQGDYEWTMPEPWTNAEADLRARARALPTNYILGYFSGPDTRSDDYMAFVVALRVLSGVVSGQARARGLSYSSGTRLVARAASGGGIYVSTVDPDRLMEIVNESIDVLGQVTLRRSDLRDYADDSVMEYYLQNMTTPQQADFLATSYLLHGRLETPSSFVEAMKDVSASDIRRIFHDYVHDIQYGYLGDTSLLPRGRLLRR